MNRPPSVASLSDAILARTLLDTCRGHGLGWGEEAALRLLVAHGTWLGRVEFRRHISLDIRYGADPVTAEPSASELAGSSEALQDDTGPVARRLSERGLRLAALVDWPGVAGEPDRSPASQSETALLRLACHLAGHLPAPDAGPVDAEWTLAEIFVPLDATYALIATRAIAMAAIGPDTVGPLT